MTVQSFSPIGGYFELELQSGKRHYYDRAYRFHSARQAMECILSARKYKAVFVPFYICDSVLEPFQRLGITPLFYKLNERLDPASLPPRLPRETALLLVNYFGVKQHGVNRLARQYRHVIVDNTQAFFSHPLKCVDTIYSPRKFFGVADGGYLCSDFKIAMDYPLASSAERIGAMVKRLECGPEVGYADFQAAEKALVKAPIQRMSPLTERILWSIDYPSARIRRRENFRFLADRLGRLNRFAWSAKDAMEGALCYPLWMKDGHSVKKALIKERIFVPTYWAEVKSRVEADSLEHHLVDDLICLPIDQRYGIAEMRRVVAVVKRLTT